MGERTLASGRAVCQVGRSVEAQEALDLRLDRNKKRNGIESVLF